MEDWLPGIIIALVSSIGASSGFWALLSKRDIQKNAEIKLLLGLAHDRIIFLGLRYIEQGFVTKDEYEDYVKYLCEPYSMFGGNGLANKVMAEVAKLPIKGAINPIVRVIEDKNV